MNAFFNALYALFIALEDEAHNAFYTSVCGRFSYGDAVDQSAKPYAVFFGLNSVPVDTFSEVLDDLDFQVNVYGDGNYQEVSAAALHCKNLFKGRVVSVNGFDLTILCVMETPPWLDGDLWTVSIEFNVIIQED